MRRRLPPLLTALTLSVLLVGILALSTTVTAQSENRALVDGLESQLLTVAIPIALAVLGAFAYAVVRFRVPDERASADDGSGLDARTGPELGPGPTLEISWTLAAAVVLLFVGIASYSVLASPYVSPDQSVEVDGSEEQDGLESLDAGDDTDVYVRASQWDWNASYPDAEVTTRNEIVIPADENVTIWLTSDDVVHSLLVPELAVRQDAIPGEYTRVRTVASEPGEYDVRCTEFCGSGHAGMTGTVVVLESDAYEAWLSAQDGDGDDDSGYKNESENDANATAFLESDAG
ncbi:cytochrome c oxidase subunit II [Halobacteria archaeon AArc-m2/3/4]|uniref:cytochrome-c oxidase n=1 Tax=Natronoglomus mannanivorans TaxID=2979990 RepID=A0ABT2QE97_9EURY|nr:cytochrome c oxidase subunit II [Halobacteria archaeon AArc-m2/3/4]